MYQDSTPQLQRIRRLINTHRLILGGLMALVLPASWIAFMEYLEAGASGYLPMALIVVFHVLFIWLAIVTLPGLFDKEQHSVTKAIAKLPDPSRAEHEFLHKLEFFDTNMLATEHYLLTYHGLFVRAFASSDIASIDLRATKHPWWESLLFFYSWILAILFVKKGEAELEIETRAGKTYTIPVTTRIETTFYLLKVMFWEDGSIVRAYDKHLHGPLKEYEERIRAEAAAESGAIDK